MDTIKKILHPKETSSHSHPSPDDNTTNTTTIPSHHNQDHPQSEPFPHEVQQQHLNREAGFPTPEAHHHNPQQQQEQQPPQPRAGHHHPRQPVGATGLPPNHKPREDFVPAPHTSSSSQHQHQHEQLPAAGAAGTEGLAPQGPGSGEDLVTLGKQIAEEGNNFPGTNPHPAHSALGNQSMTGERGTLMPGRE